MISVGTGITSNSFAGGCKMILALVSLGHSLKSHAFEQIKWLFYFRSEFRMANVRKTLKENLIFDIYTKRRLLPPSH